MKPKKGYTAKEKKERKHTIPITYQSTWTWKEKCLYILKEGEAMSVRDILKKVIELEPNIKHIRLMKARNNINLALNKFIRDKIVKEIEARKFGYNEAQEGRKVVLISPD